MQPVVTAAEARALDRVTMADVGLPGVVMMEVAGRGVAVEVQRALAARPGPVVVVCGGGGNGGDGLVVARVLRAETALQLTAGGARPHPRALTAQLAGGPFGGWRGRAEGWAALRRAGPWVLDAELCHDSGAVELCAGYWRLRGAAAEALRLWDDGAWPTVGPRDPALLGGFADQVSSSARLRLGAWRVELAGWADPATRAPTHALARVATAPLCGGFELGLGADLRVGQRRPDVLAQLVWRGGAAAARCASW